MKFNLFKKSPNCKPSSKIALDLIHENLGWKWYIYSQVHEVQPEERYERVIQALNDNELKMTKEHNEEYIAKEAQAIADLQHYLGKGDVKKAALQAELLKSLNALRKYYSGLRIDEKIAFNFITNFTVVETPHWKEDPSVYSTEAIQRKEEFLINNPEEKKTLLLIAWTLTGDLKNMSPDNIPKYMTVRREGEKVLTSLIQQVESAIQKL